jgi:hypothetical protein
MQRDADERNEGTRLHGHSGMDVSVQMTARYPRDIPGKRYVIRALQCALDALAFSCAHHLNRAPVRRHSPHAMRPVIAVMHPALPNISAIGSSF